MEFKSHPVLIFTVKGTSIALLTSFTISPIKSGYFISEEPDFDFIAIFGTGHPIFIFSISGLTKLHTFIAASFKLLGLSPKS